MDSYKYKKKLGFAKRLTISEDIFHKGTVSVISSDPPCKEDNARLTMVPLKPFTVNRVETYHRNPLEFLKMRPCTLCTCTQTADLLLVYWKKDRLLHDNSVFKHSSVNFYFLPLLESNCRHFLDI